MKVKREHDPALDVFDRGCLKLSRDGRPVGHIATVLWSFRTPFKPLTKQDWVWILVVWGSGEREMPIEEYPPFDGYVAGLLEGRFEWQGVTYEAVWLPDGERQRAWAELGISEDDF